MRVRPLHTNPQLLPRQHITRPVEPPLHAVLARGESAVRPLRPPEPKLQQRGAGGGGEAETGGVRRDEGRVVHEGEEGRLEELPDGEGAADAEEGNAGEAYGALVEGRYGEGAAVDGGEVRPEVGTAGGEEGLEVADVRGGEPEGGEVLGDLVQTREDAELTAEGTLAEVEVEDGRIVVPPVEVVGVGHG